MCYEQQKVTKTLSMLFIKKNKHVNLFVSVKDEFESCNLFFSLRIWKV